MIRNQKKIYSSVKDFCEKPLQLKISLESLNYIGRKFFSKGTMLDIVNAIKEKEMLEVLFYEDFFLEKKSSRVFVGSTVKHDRKRKLMITGLKRPLTTLILLDWA